MLNIYKIEDTKLPALVVGDDVLTGFKDIKTLENKVIESFKIEKKVEAGDDSRDNLSN